MDNLQNIDELEQLRKKWAEINSRLEALEHNTVEESRRVSTGKVKTAKDELSKSYKRFMILELAMSLVMPFFVIFNRAVPSVGEGYRIVCAILFAAFFVTDAVMDAYLQNALNAIDLGSMSVRQVARRACTLKRRHHIFMAILIPFAVVVLGVFVYPFLDDYYLLAGAIVGGLFGLALGLKEYFRMMANYREIIRDYED